MNESKRVLALILGALVSGAALAQTNTVSHIGLLQTDVSRAEQGKVSETDGVLALATIYFQEVGHGDDPHSQAFFLERAASLTLGYTDFDIDLGPFATGGEASGLDVQYIMNTHWVVGGGYSRFEVDNFSEQDSHNVEFGRYLDDTSRVLLTYAKADNDMVFTPDTTTRTYGLEYKNVTKHPAATTAVTLDMKYNHIDASAGTSDLFGVQGEYHFTLASSVIGGVQVTTGEDEGYQYNLGALHFLTRFFAVGAEFTRKEPDTGTHTNTFAVRARLLF
jgi:hypothetical protein